MHGIHWEETAWRTRAILDHVMRRSLFALLVSIPLAASGMAGVVFHVCHSMGGVAVGTCGCGTGAHQGGDHAVQEAPAELQAQPCCTFELSNLSQSVAAQERSSQQVNEASVGLVRRSDISVVASLQACDLGLLGERAPPSVHGPPIFVRNCSFLN